MSKHKAMRLNLLARLAALKTQSNLADLQLRQQLLQKQQLAHLQLQSYQDEYFNKQSIDTATQGPISVSALKNNSRFMADLNYAVGAQQRQQVPLPHGVPGRLHREKRAAAAAELGDFLGRLRGFLPQTHFEWVDMGRTILLHVDYWILIAVAYAFARQLTQRAADRKLRRVKAAMAYARHRDATYTSVETGMLEWINHLLRHEWRAVISAVVDEQARATMERAMRDASAMSGGVVRRAVVEEATFGVVPPDLKLYVSRYNPAEDYLQFEFDFRWDTVSSHIVIQADISVPGSGTHTRALGSAAARSETHAALRSGGPSATARVQTSLTASTSSARAVRARRAADERARETDGARASAPRAARRSSP